MTQYPPNNAGELAARALRRGDATGWFEPLYARAAPDGQGVPWARMQPDPALAAWLPSAAGKGEPALVVGCGLGDDAEALAGAGYAVTAFDVAPSAVALAKQRFPESRVTYQTADLFKPPKDWAGAFALVVELLTVQSLPPALHADAIRQIAGFVAPGGRAFVGSTVRIPEMDPTGPPWPVSAADMAAWGAAGLSTERTTKRAVGKWDRVWQVRTVYQRAAEDK